MYGIYIYILVCIYANIGGILMVNVSIYTSTMDRMGSVMFTVFTPKKKEQVT